MEFTLGLGGCRIFEKPGEGISPSENSASSTGFSQVFGHLTLVNCTGFLRGHLVFAGNSLT